MNDAFWRNPPWHGGKGGYRMGLRPIEPSDWLPDRITSIERRRKLALLDDPTTFVYAEIASSLASQQMLLNALQQHLGTSTDMADVDRPPLQRAALLVPDDLCLMQRDGESYRLTGACVCSPSYWHLADKIGQPLAGIHAPVPSLNEKLAATMAQFFERLPAGLVFERRNWLIHRDDEPFHQTSEQWPAAATPDAATLYMRSERQTLRRLDDATIVFTIRVTCRHLCEIAAYPQAMHDLLATFDALDADERRASGFVHYGAAVTSYLRRALTMSRAS